ncbi:unnamed protein product [Boreogadus saida]
MYDLLTMKGRPKEKMIEWDILAAKDLFCCELCKVNSESHEASLWRNTLLHSSAAAVHDRVLNRRCYDSLVHTRR